MEISIRTLKKQDWELAMQLAWDTFLIYEAPEYDPEGVKNFHDFVKGDELRNMFLLGEYHAWGAFDKDNIMVGVLGIRKHWHISLLFVDPGFHHQKIASRLLKEAFGVAAREGITEMTVFSSPYAVDFYHRIGFTDMGHEKTTDGIRYTPMKIDLF